jgi:arginine exporter protein ArgO
MSQQLIWFLAGAACASMAWFVILMAINEGLLQARDLQTAPGRALRACAADHRRSCSDSNFSSN